MTLPTLLFPLAYPVSNLTKDHLPWLKMVQAGQLDLKLEAAEMKTETNKAKGEDAL
jgi:hypothetical protein